MIVIDWMRFLAGTICLIIGVIVFIIQMIGIFKFKYILDRMHAAALGDTLGIGCCLVGLMLLSGFHFTTLKLGLILIFLWLASPVSSHLIAKLEMITNEKLEEKCEILQGDERKEMIELPEDAEEEKNDQSL